MDLYHLYSSNNPYMSCLIVLISGFQDVPLPPADELNNLKRLLNAL